MVYNNRNVYSKVILFIYGFLFFKCRRRKLFTDGLLKTFLVNSSPPVVLHYSGLERFSLQSPNTTTTTTRDPLNGSTESFLGPRRTFPSHSFLRTQHYNNTRTISSIFHLCTVFINFFQHYSKPEDET